MCFGFQYHSDSIGRNWCNCLQKLLRRLDCIIRQYFFSLRLHFFPFSLGLYADRSVYLFSSQHRVLPFLAAIKQATKPASMGLEGQPHKTSSSSNFKTSDMQTTIPNNLAYHEIKCSRSIQRNFLKPKKMCGCPRCRV